MNKLVISTKTENEVVDLTPQIEDLVKQHANGFNLVHVFLPHTSAALTTADLDPGTDQDLLDAYEAMVPKLKYRHPHDPSHVGDHIMSSLLGTSIAIPCENNEMLLGPYQRIILVEFYGPKERTIIVNFS
ncbi:secondary thiamine-phosphate synthase enzyme YjbQ [Patescibacteria group bacterium]|nr:secondary thiamine-phosphate synthase enzyme YjbQ [Patescibacteria group bacterium]MBU1705213.1 secondary thiamine-phosphate synthase enzyme YjbQ [Patescibacteria group bacterium]